MAGISFLALAPRFAFAQAKVPRIGYLLTVPLAEKPSAERVAFLEGLRDLGYIDGQSVAVHYRAAAGNLELLPDLAAELVDLNVDVIVVTGFQAVQATKQATRTVRDDRRRRSGRHWARGQPGPPWRKPELLDTDADGRHDAQAG
jgi:ABC-type uncharacterized transport system substrate-binding protein